jgi:hypothetical protein
VAGWQDTVEQASVRATVGGLSAFGPAGAGLVGWTRPDAFRWLALACHPAVVTADGAWAAAIPASVGAGIGDMARFAAAPRPGPVIGGALAAALAVWDRDLDRVPTRSRPGSPSPADVPGWSAARRSGCAG